jgi:hypothetical protein
MTATLRAGLRSNFARQDPKPSSANVRRLGEGDIRLLGEWIELLARISHDLRTPLNAVIGFSDAMQQELFGPLGHSRYQEYASHIRSSGDQLLRATEETLRMTALLASPNSVELADIRLCQLLDLVLDEFADVLAETGIGCNVAIPADLEVSSDPRILHRALQQMTSASLAYALPGSQLSITAASGHGHVGLAVCLSGGAADHVLPVGDSGGHATELGIGRESLSIWLARTLLDKLDAPLTVGWDGSCLELRTTLEQTLQPDFFA